MYAAACPSGLACAGTQKSGPERLQVQRQDLAYILATGYVALSLLLAGFYLRTSEFKLRPLVWLSYISYPRCAAWVKFCFDLPYS